MTPFDFTLAVHTYCLMTDGSVTSWVRTGAHNRQVGGVADSPHLYGLGADVVYDGSLVLGFATQTAARLGLTLLREGDHDHLQPADWRP